MGKSSIIFFERRFPSANMVLIRDQLPMLIDTGFGSDAKGTGQLLQTHIIIVIMLEGIFTFKQIME